MKRILLLFSIIIMFTLCSCQKNQENQPMLNSSDKSKVVPSSNTSLTMEKKLKDYDFLYEIITENSPAVILSGMQENNKWEETYKEYRKKIKESKNDEEFFNTLYMFLNKLNSHHTQVATKEFVQYMKVIYENEMNKLNQKSWQTYMVNVFNNPQVVKRNDLNNVNKSSSFSYAERQFQQDKQVITKDIVNNKIGYIYMPRMKSPNECGKDKEVIRKYLSAVKDYDSLIIDIRGNMGGDSRYWSEFFVPHIAKQDYKYHTYHLYKDGAKIREYISYRKSVDKDFAENLSEIKNSEDFSFKNIPPNILNEFKYVYDSEQLIKPSKNSIKFQGKIYIIIDSHVYSSADAFADFAKSTGFATLVGQRTSGAGISSDPLLCWLPKSGYVFQFEKELGVSSDGRINALEKTVPDVAVEDTTFKDFQEDDCIQTILQLEEERKKQ